MSEIGHRPGHAASGGAELCSLRQAAALCCVDVSTIKRDRDRGRYPNAVPGESPARRWVIPVTDLIRAGRYRPEQGADPADALGLIGLQREIAEVRAELAAAQAALQIARAELVVERHHGERLWSLLGEALRAALVKAVA